MVLAAEGVSKSIKVERFDTGLLGVSKRIKTFDTLFDTAVACHFGPKCSIKAASKEYQNSIKIIAGDNHGGASPTHFLNPLIAHTG